MSHEVDAQWIGKMQFNAAIDGHTVIMDAPERAGGEGHGPIPKKPDGHRRDQRAALEAVDISQEKYCGVSSMLKKIIPVTWEVMYNGLRVFTNRPAVVG